MVAMIPFFVLAIQPTPREVHQRQYLEAKYQSLNHAIKTLSFPSVREWMTENAAPDFFDHVSGASTLSGPQTVQLMKDQFLILQSVKNSTIKLGNLVLKEDRMSCSVRTHLDEMTKDKRHILVDSIAVNNWKLLHKKWKIISMVTTRSQTLVNGKPVIAGRH